MTKIIEEIDKRISTLEEQITDNPHDKRTVDAKQSYVIGKEIIQIQMDMKTATDEELKTLGKKLVDKLETLENLSEKCPQRHTILTTCICGRGQLLVTSPVT